MNSRYMTTRQRLALAKREGIKEILDGYVFPFVFLTGMMVIAWFIFGQ